MSAKIQIKIGSEIVKYLVEFMTMRRSARPFRLGPMESQWQIVSGDSTIFTTKKTENR